MKHCRQERPWKTLALKQDNVLVNKVTWNFGKLCSRLKQVIYTKFNHFFIHYSMICPAASARSVATWLSTLSAMAWRAGLAGFAASGP